MREGQLGRAEEEAQGPLARYSPGCEHQIVGREASGTRGTVARLGIGLVLLMMVVLPASGFAEAAPTTIDCTSDTAALRNALWAASNGDSFLVSGPCQGPIEMESPMADHITLRGIGPSPTLHGGNPSVSVGYGGVVTISDVTIDASYMTGVENGGTLILDGVTVTGNTGWTRPNPGAPGEVGGIYNTGTLTLVNSTVTGNSGGDGFMGWSQPGDPFGDPGGPGGAGGVENHGSLTIISSTVAGNTGGMGGIGGMGNMPGPDGPDGVGGIEGSASLTASIVAGNQSQGVRDCQGLFTSGGYNLIGTVTGCSFTSAGNDLTGTDATPINAHLSSLASSGGPTPTMALGLASPAVDAIPSGDDACPTEDQRGIARPQRGGCDIGAYELNAPATELTIGAPRRVAAGAVATVRGELESEWAACLKGQRVAVMKGRHKLATGKTTTGGAYAIGVRVTRTVRIHTEFVGTPWCGPSASEERTIRAT